MAAALTRSIQPPARQRSPRFLNEFLLESLKILRQTLLLFFFASRALLAIVENYMIFERMCDDSAKEEQLCIINGPAGSAWAPAE